MTDKIPVYFITGASGVIGRQVCRQLKNLGYSTHAIVRKTDVELLRLGVKTWEGDLWDIGILKDALSNANVIIHCAGNARFGNGAQYQRDNIDLTAHIVNAAKKYADKNCRFVFLSSIGAVDRYRFDSCKQPLSEGSLPFPTSDYGKSKLAAENVVKRSGLAHAIVRPTMVVGREMRFDSHFAVFARYSISGSILGRIGWPGMMSVVHVSDLADAILTVSIHPQATNQIFYCSGDNIAINDFFKLCTPTRSLFPLSRLKWVMEPFIGWLPFSLKVMCFPALTATNQKLEKLGWQHHYSAKNALEEVINREKARLDPQYSPGGQTVITGAASGLGRAFTDYLASRRERILLIDLDLDSLIELCKKYDNCVPYKIDLSKEAQIEQLIRSKEWNEAQITEIFACAGIGYRGRMQDMPLKNHRKMFSVNVLSRIALLLEAINQMKRHHFGRLVLISSSSAFQPLPFMATYAATNSALLFLGEAWAREIKEDNIDLLIACPGGMKTNFQKKAGVKEIEGEKLMLPETVVNKIILGLKQQKRTLIISSRSVFMSLLARLLPRSLSVSVWYKLMEKMR